MTRGKTHTSFFKGSKVRAILRDGTVIIGKFMEKVNHRAIRIEVGGKRIEIHQADLSSCNYYKPLPHELKQSP